MEYNSPTVIGIKPTARSWHSSTLLAQNKLLIHGGFDGSNNMVLGDSFIFNIGEDECRMTTHVKNYILFHFYFD